VSARVRSVPSDGQKRVSMSRTSPGPATRATHHRDFSCCLRSFSAMDAKSSASLCISSMVKGKSSFDLP